MNYKPILLIGKMGSGKTTLAKYLTHNHGYHQLSMATWLKQTICNHYGIERIDKNSEFNGVPMRTILQKLGMAARDIDPNWHIDEVLNFITRLQYNRESDRHFVIDDVRFVNEAKRLTERIECVKIKVVVPELVRLERMILRDLRVPTESQLNDISEREVDSIEYDYIINNDCDLCNAIDQLELILKGMFTHA